LLEVDVIARKILTFTEQRHRADLFRGKRRHHEKSDDHADPDGMSVAPGARVWILAAMSGLQLLVAPDDDASTKQGKR
jgi:hypothetical protein